MTKQTNNSNPSSNHIDLMKVAFSLARRGLGNVWPNPAVGCIIVKNGRIVGRGWTQPGGRPHAEAMALKQPMICSDTDFSKYLCKKSAIYANPKNYDEWAEKIIILSNSTEKRRELSEEGFSRFNSINSIAKDTYKSYWEIQSQ